MAKKAKPDFRSTSSQRSSLSQVLQMPSATTTDAAHLAENREPSPFHGAEPGGADGAANALEPVRKPVDSRRKKLAHLKTLLEYREKKAVNDLLYQIGNEVGHTIHFSIFNRGLLQAALDQEAELLRAARSIAGLPRPSNSEVEALRNYEKQIALMIYKAFRIGQTL